MTTVNYPSSSPYYDTPQLSWRIGRWVPRSIPPASDDTYLVINPKYQYRPDRLSFDLYGSAAYWWVFMARNIDLIRDPTYDMVAGMQIVIPSSATVQQSLKF